MKYIGGVIDYEYCGREIGLWDRMWMVKVIIG
jgi:hypothetical protein